MQVMASALDRVVLASGALAAAGLEDMVWGHVAVRDPDGRGVWMKAAGWAMAEVTPERVLLVGWDGAVLQGHGNAHIESHIHLQAMLARPDVGVCVHVHPPSVHAFAALDVPMRAISHAGVLFADPQVPRYPGSGDLIADPASGAALAAALGVAPACLMPRHGLVAVGPDTAHAVMHAVLLTQACEAMLAALAAGEVRSYSDADELSAKRAHVWPASQINAGYEYLVRRAAP